MQDRNSGKMTGREIAGLKISGKVARPANAHPAFSAFLLNMTK